MSRHDVVHIRLSETERAAAKRVAAQSGLTLSSYMRYLLFSALRQELKHPPQDNPAPDRVAA